LRATLAASELRYTASEQFRTRVLQALEKAERPQHSERAWRSLPWWNWVAAAACLLVAVGGLLLYSGNRRDETLARELVADHVRSLMATHLTDVLTSDQHTVKPWFTGKLDFSPRVRDLSADGFELIGGRLDYVDGHSAAAIVYQRRKHVINLFTWPAKSGDESPHTTAQQGFNLIEWTQDGMYYCAISDLNQQELREFVELMRK
jgi:anti-sigma factor RsiW